MPEQIRPDSLSRGRGGLPSAQGAVTRHGERHDKEQGAAVPYRGDKAAGIGEPVRLDLLFQR